MTLRVVLMGVAGSGKSAVGAALSARLGVPYRDGDDLHSTASVDKMRSGVALADADRLPWLARIAGVLAIEAPVIVGCSALRRHYRDRIRAGVAGPVRFVHLAGSRDVIAARLAARTGHYMPASLLDSQFAALEPPGPDEGALVVDIDQPLDVLVDRVIAGLEAME